MLCLSSFWATYACTIPGGAVAAVVAAAAAAAAAAADSGGGQRTRDVTKR